MYNQPFDYFLGFPLDVGNVGRLDMDSTGILLFTNNTQVAHFARDPLSGFFLFSNFFYSCI